MEPAKCSRLAKLLNQPRVRKGYSVMTYGRTRLKTVNHSYCEGPPYSNCTGNREPVITIVMVANTNIIGVLPGGPLPTLVSYQYYITWPGRLPASQLIFNKSGN